jgi:hypothetical protein
MSSTGVASVSILK